MNDIINVRLTFDLPLDPFISRLSMSRSAPSDTEEESEEERRQGGRERRQGERRGGKERGEYRGEETMRQRGE